MQRPSGEAFARTLRSSAGSLKFALIAVLFLPGLVATGYIPHHYQYKAAEPLQQAAHKPLPRKLVKIFSIVTSNRPDLLEHQAWELSEVILTESSKYKLDPILVLAVIDVESKFQFAAVSPAGARGIMQIMPGTGRFLAETVEGVSHEFKAVKFTPEHLDDPILNIKLGTYYLHDLRRSFRNIQKALIAYNLGPTELRSRLENQIEYADRYASAVFAAYDRYKNVTPSTF